MPIFTAEIAGQPTIVFAALNDGAAIDFVDNAFVRSELAGLRTQEGVSLWDGKTDISYRPASKNEHNQWERNLFEDLIAGVHESREDAIASNGFAFLVEYLEPGE